MKINKLLWVILGCVCVGLGAVGAVVPMIPSFPFLLCAAASFAKSSMKLHTWFISTKLYKSNLESYVEGRGMTIVVKLRIMSIVTLLMSVGFAVMFIKGIYLPCIILLAVWLFHVFYFLFRVKTLKKKT